MKSRIDTIGSGRKNVKSKHLGTSQERNRQSKQTNLHEEAANSRDSTPKTQKSQGQYSFANPSKRSSGRFSPESVENVPYDSNLPNDSFTQDHSNPFRRGNLCLESRLSIKC